MRKELLIFALLMSIAFACSKTKNNSTKQTEQFETIAEFADEEPLMNVKEIPTPDLPPAPPEIIEIQPAEEINIALPPPPKSVAKKVSSKSVQAPPPPPPPPPAPKREMISMAYESRQLDYVDTEEYAPLIENKFRSVTEEPLSTFSIDVDRASYSNMRRFIQNGQLPPQNAVRIEEMINYFDYGYEASNHKHPYNIQMHLTESPWNDEFQLAHIALQAKRIDTDDLPASNLTFLIDVSGSMSSQNKLPLLQSGFNLLIDNLREEDKVSIVVYAGAAGMVLPPTSGADKATIRNAIDRLQAGGSTAGGAGIELAYKTATENFIKGGNNRVILATDGDFNVGISSNEGLENLIKKKKESGVFLSVLGFGTGNYKDGKMETLANKGNGNYAYIDNITEAKKVFVNEFGGTLFTVAKDVKLQVEFNPNTVKAYRLIGYANRMLENRDFNDDKKDAGEMGAGHSVTAIYEIVPTGAKSHYNSTDELKYQTTKTIVGGNKKDILTVKTRYKLPDESSSKIFNQVLKKDSFTAFKKLDKQVKFSIAVTEFGLLLRNSEFKGNANYDHVIEIVKDNRGRDEEGEKAEFMRLVKSAQLLDRKYTSRE